MNNVYLLKLGEIEEIKNTPNDDYTHPLFEDLALVLNDEYGYIGFSDDESVFVRMTDYKLKYLEYIISKYTTFTKVDVTNRVLSGEIQMLYPELEEISPKIFENFRLEVTTIDNILDRILDYGLPSLDSVDLAILEREKTTQ